MQEKLLVQIKKSTDKQLYDIYKIQINPDGSVYDRKTKSLYPCLVEWANNLNTRYQTIGY